jgi:ribosomal RNA-processing protein 9
LALDCVRYITQSEWVSGGDDGSLQVWSQLKKKPLAVLRGAHGQAHVTSGDVPPERGSWAVAGSAADGWVQSVAVCRGSDLVASGAGDGAIKLWEVVESKHGGAGGLRHIGSVPARGYVNGLALARSGRFVMAALGQEPRLGRWGRAQGARNGVLLHPLDLGAGA